MKMKMKTTKRIKEQERSACGMRNEWGERKNEDELLLVRWSADG